MGRSYRAHLRDPEDALPQDRLDMEIIKHDGRWCPANAKKAWNKYTQSAADMSDAVARCAERRVAIQAGGNIGAWPVWLSKRFQHVYTFEPDVTNYRCLARNCDPYRNICPFNAALGPEVGMCKLVLEEGMGGHHVSTIGEGKTAMLSIDSLNLEYVDLIVLDVEGMEWEALVGARDTIARCRPIIQLEDKNHGTNKGRGRTMTDIRHELAEYVPVNYVRHDVIMEWRA